MRGLRDDVARAVDFHRHFCPGQCVGEELLDFYERLPAEG